MCDLCFGLGECRTKKSQSRSKSPRLQASNFPEALVSDLVGLAVERPDPLTTALAASLPHLINALFAPVQHQHTHVHYQAEPMQQPPTSSSPHQANPYRNSVSQAQVVTVEMLEQWLLSQPKSPQVDQALRFLATRQPQEVLSQTTRDQLKMLTR